MAAFFRNVLTASFHGSIVILAVILLRLILRKAPRKSICWLWMLAGLRLLLPIPLQSRFSLQPVGIAIPDWVSRSVVLPILWGAIAAGIAVYSVLSYWQLRRQVMDAIQIPGGWESDRIDTAFVLGFLKPKIYIPTGLSKDTRQQILAHERTHLDKGDHWIKMIGFLALALHWFNPLVWLSYILLCKDIEMACDERVVQFMELEERKAYSTALLRCSTDRIHYAACPVAFGEVSVKYRIQSVLKYKKPGFWMSLLGLLAICFVAVCLLTSPAEVVEVPVDGQEQLTQRSRQDPVTFTPAKLPELPPNPDWGVTVFVDALSPTGGKIVYAVEERFAAASESIAMKDGTLDRWNGTDWEPVPSLSGKTTLFEQYRIGFAQSRDQSISYFSEELEWGLLFGALSEGDYRITQTICSDTDSAVFQTAFHIYREQLPDAEEAALQRCQTALEALCSSTEYSVIFSELNPAGEISPVKRITKANGTARIDWYLGEYSISSAQGDQVLYQIKDWDAPFRLNQNRQILFPEKQSIICQEEITFCSVWSDFQGNAYRGTDTYRFYDNGKLKSVDRTIQTVEEAGKISNQTHIRLEVITGSSYFGYVESLDSYAVVDSFDAQLNSPWGIFFRVDDDLLKPGSGEIWLGTNAVGVSNYRAGGTYWLEKKIGQRWERLGGDDKQASWGAETIPLTSRTTVINVDWTEDYGKLDAGVYRMGTHFYHGEESIIQYAEFAIYPTGGIFGAGGEAAVARVDDAIAKLQSGFYRVEKQTACFGYDGFLPELQLCEVHWKYGETMVVDFYQMGSYRHSAVTHPGDVYYGNWFKRSWDNEEYDCIYFPEGYSVISDREIRFAHTYSRTSTENPVTWYTYRFDEQGNLTEILQENCYATWDGYVSRYVITQTPEQEIRAWVDQKQADQ